MPLDESFAPEPEAVAPAALVEDAPAPGTAPAAEAPQTPAADTTPPEPAPASAEAPTAPQGGENQPASAFDEAAYLKSVYGDDAPATAAEAKERHAALQAKQLTADHEARLAVVGDPAKLAEFAKLHGTDYDKATAREVMQARFAEQHPGMSEAQIARRFDAQFAQKYPTLAAFLADPESVAADDPALVAEKEDADYDAQADRTHFKTTQTQKIADFLAATAAPQGPQLTAAQQADAAALPAWLDEAMKDGATLPVQVGENQTINLPIGKSADFKADFSRTVELAQAQSFTKDGLLNRDNHALVTRFLQNPQQFVQEVARLAVAAQPKPAPAIPLADLANTSTPRASAPPAAAPVVGSRNHDPHIDADSWQKTNI